MIIKKCDVCKEETDSLYDKSIATHVDVVNGRQYIRASKLHICRTCLNSINNTELTAQLGWYEDNVKEENTNPENGDNSEVNNGNEDNPNGNEQGNSEDAGGTTVGE